MVNLRDEFVSTVIEPFIHAYAKGVTPNPCILCNKNIKFPYLLKIAHERGADYIATGHYARVEHCSPEAQNRKASELPHFRTSVLKKGIDLKKDQSYVLYVLTPELLDRLLLPLGEKRKEEVRQMARERNLSAARRPESQEICFIEDRYYFRFVEELTGETKGPMIDIETGKTLGQHKGIHLYTPGQRKRLGVATGKPLYVVRIDAKSNTVYVGPREAALAREFSVDEVNWLIPPPTGTQVFRAMVKIRSTMRDEPATLHVLDHNRVKVVYDEPQWAPAPGQAAVFYEGDVVIGGGVIQ